MVQNGGPVASGRKSVIALAGGSSGGDPKWHGEWGATGGKGNKKIALQPWEARSAIETVVIFLTPRITT
jgi:hypothetical protein